MANTFKKTIRLSFFVSLTFLLFCHSKITTYAKEYMSGKCGNNLTYTVTGDNKDNLTLTISGTGDMWDYYNGSSAGNTSPWFAYYAEEIRTIELEDGITSIGSNAFNRGGRSGWCYKASISFPSTLKSIGDYAFYGCDIYGNLIIPEGVTYIGEYAFSGCKGLNGYLSLPDSLTTLGYKAFYFGGLGDLFNMTGPLKLPKNLKKIPGYAFYGCDKFTSVTFGSSVTSIGEYAFYNCSGIKSVSFPNTLSLIDQYAFNGTSLTGTIYFPASITQIKSYAFRNTDLTMARFLGNAPTENSDAFESKVTVYFSKNALGFTLPEWHGYASDSDRIRVTGVKITPATQTIYRGDTAKFTAVLVPSDADIKDVSWTVNGSKVEADGYSFTYTFTSTGTFRVQVVTSDGGCIATCTVIVQEKTGDNGTAKIGDKVNYKNAVYMLTKLPSGSKAGEAKLVSVSANKASIVVPKSFNYNGKKYNVTAIGAGACKNNKTLTSFTIGANVKSIGDNAFFGCTRLKSAKIPDKVKTIGKNAYRNCTGITTITIGKNVTNINSYAFYGCKRLKKWTIKSSKLKKLGNNAMKKTPKAASYDVPDSKKDYYWALFIVSGAGRSIKVK
jgi:hypothetical protein